MGHPPAATEPHPDLVRYAVHVGNKSPCAKSKRGVVAFTSDSWTSQPFVIVGEGFNGPPRGFTCGGDDACRASCAKYCVHAELRALWSAHDAFTFAGHATNKAVHLVHVKVVEGELVAGGGPSCWQCSRQLLDMGAAGIWLFEAPMQNVAEHGGMHPPIAEVQMGPGRWRYYDALGFHARTLDACGIRATMPAVAP